MTWIVLIVVMCTIIGLALFVWIWRKSKTNKENIEALYYEIIDMDKNDRAFIEKCNEGISKCNAQIEALLQFNDAMGKNKYTERSIKRREHPELNFWMDYNDKFEELIKESIEAKPMKSKGTYVVIDIETTGFSPAKDLIIEVGAILVDEDYNEISTFESFVKTPYIPPFITKLTGITVRDTKDAPTLIEVLSSLSEFCGDAIPVAHYAPFDKKFIRHYLKETNTSYIQTTWIDSINIFKQKYPGMPNYKLETLIREFNLATKEDHRALSDARHTLTLLKK